MVEGLRMGLGFGFGFWVGVLGWGLDLRVSAVLGLPRPGTANNSGGIKH